MDNEDIDPQTAEDIAVLDRVLDRVQRGVPKGREINDDEVMPVLRAAYTWRNAACAASSALTDARLRALE